MQRWIDNSRSSRCAYSNYEILRNNYEILLNTQITIFIKALGGCIFALEMKKLTGKDKEGIAFDLYMNTDKTQIEICEIVGWNPKTFSQKKKLGKWEELRGASEITAHKITINLYKRLSEITEEGKAIKADEIIKLANAIEKISNKKVTVSNVINVFKDFTSWLMETDPEMAKLIIEKQKLFVNLKINGNG